MNIVKAQKKTRYRFSFLVNELKSTKCSRLRHVILRVINSFTDNATNTTDRVRIRNEYIGKFCITHRFVNKNNKYNYIISTEVQTNAVVLIKQLSISNQSSSQCNF